MMTTESPEIRLKRLTMRSWRRGMKEMDIIFGNFANAELSRLPVETLDEYERLLEENDQDLYKWISGAAPTPAAFENITTIVANFHRIRG